MSSKELSHSSWGGVLEGICEALGAPPGTAISLKSLYGKWNEHQSTRVVMLLKAAGEEYTRGDSEEDWHAFRERIDDPRFHTTVIYAARQAIDAFDEAAIPYIAKVVAWHLAEEEPLTKRKTRWLLKLLAECDNRLLLTIRHNP